MRILIKKNTQSQKKNLSYLLHMAGVRFEIFHFLNLIENVPQESEELKCPTEFSLSEFYYRTLSRYVCLLQLQHFSSESWQI